MYRIYNIIEPAHVYAWSAAVYYRIPLVVCFIWAVPRKKGP